MDQLSSGGVDHIQQTKQIPHVDYYSINNGAGLPVGQGAALIEPDENRHRIVYGAGQLVAFLDHGHQGVLRPDVVVNALRLVGQGFELLVVH